MRDGQHCGYIERIQTSICSSNSTFRKLRCASSGIQAHNILLNTDPYVITGNFAWLSGCRTINSQLDRSNLSESASFRLVQIILENVRIKDYVRQGKLVGSRIRKIPSKFSRGFLTWKQAWKTSQWENHENLMTWKFISFSQKRRPGNYGIYGDFRMKLEIWKVGSWPVYENFDITLCLSHARLLP